MILFSQDPIIATREGSARQWLTDELGTEDADALVRWLWQRHGSTPEFVEVLDGIRSFTREQLRGLLDHAKKPPAIREAETDLFGFMKPLIERAAATVAGHRGDENVAAAELESLALALKEKLRSMFPAAHRAQVDGAMMSGLQHRGGSFVLNVGLVVQTMFLEDPLAVNAAASWG